MKRTIIILLTVLSLFASCNSKEGRLERAVNDFKASLPMSYGNGLTCTDMTIEDSVVVYHILADERKRQASLSWEEQDIRSQMEATMSELSKSTAPADLEVIKGYRIFVECDKGMAFDYVGQDSKYNFRIIIPYLELKKQVGY